MSVILVFLLVIAGFAGWWLSHQRLMAKPWLEQGMIGDVIGREGSALPTAK
ncbi:MAG: cytochrome-c oxidase, partial [Mesorhizobium sp.]